MKDQYSSYIIEQIIPAQFEIWAYSSDIEYEKEYSTRVECLALIRYGSGSTDVVYMVSGYDGVLCAERLIAFLRIGYERSFPQAARELRLEKRQRIIDAREEQAVAKKRRLARKEKKGVDSP